MASIGKLIAIRIFSSRSAPADSVWNALDSARRAAMTDDLAHVPSIARIANVFTKMLEQLQGMKRNRNDFYEIANEIGKLMESIVQHAKQHGTTSQRFTELCDGFLSAISSMQSEMEQLFGAPTKRFANAKAYKQILPSYHFRIKCLRSDLQALTLSSSPSTGFFSNARGVVITGGTLTEVQGNQYIIHDHGTMGTQAFLGHTSIDPLSTGRTDDFDVSDYRVFKYGDLEVITAPSMKYRQNLKCNDTNGQDIVQEQYVVRIGNQIKTARTYKGNCALKDDIRKIQNFRHPNIVQLFGVCLSNTNPTIILHGDIRNIEVDPHLDARNVWLLKFRMQREWKAVCHYLMEMDYDQFAHLGYLLASGIAVEGYTHNYSWYLYVDNHQHLQMSIESPIKNYDGFRTVFNPCFSSYEMEAIENGLSLGTVPDSYQIDRKSCLLNIHYYMSYPPRITLLTPSTAAILISPMRCARAARLTFDREYRFTWEGWHVKTNGPDVEMSHVTIENNPWTRLTIPLGALSKDHAIIHCHSNFMPPPRYRETWLAQAERIMSQIRRTVTGCKEMTLVTGVQCDISFQTHLWASSPLQNIGPVFLFIRDLWDVDEALDIAWFWAKDLGGLERFSQADMLALGLDEPRPSTISFDSWYLPPFALEELRVFHEVLGFAADSPDIPRLLDLPVASVEWDGGEN